MPLDNAREVREPGLALRARGDPIGLAVGPNSFGETLGEGYCHLVNVKFGEAADVVVCRIGRLLSDRLTVDVPPFVQGKGFRDGVADCERGLFFGGIIFISAVGRCVAIVANAPRGCGCDFVVR